MVAMVAVLLLLAEQIQEMPIGHMSLRRQELFDVLVRRNAARSEPSIALVEYSKVLNDQV